MDWTYEQTRCAFGFRPGQLRPSCCECNSPAIGYIEEPDGFQWEYCKEHIPTEGTFISVIET